MPQMSPLNWMSIYLLMIILFVMTMNKMIIINMIKMSFQTYYTNKMPTINWKW